MTRIALALVPFALAASVRAQTPWTVDDDGPADFSSIAAAVAAVADGDILLVEPGSYGSVFLDKEISILGNPAGPPPAVQGLFAVNVDAFLCFRLAVGRIVVENVPLRSRIDDCDVGPQGISIVDAAELVVTRTRVAAASFEGADLDGTPAVDIDGASNVELVDCTLVGSEGAASIGQGGFGGAAVRARGGSQTWIAGCDLTGGKGGFHSFGGLHGLGGEGLLVFGGAQVNVRGSSFHTLRGGLSGGGCCAAPAIRVSIGSPPLAVTYSGVTTIGAADGVAVSPPEPYLYVRGEDGPGKARRLFLYGEAGQPGVVVTSFSPDLLTNPLVLGIPLWLDVNSLVEVIPVVLLGQDSAVNLTWTVPSAPGVTGLTYIVQAAELDPPGFFQGTNSANVIAAF